jgi:hypothetical protein
VVVVVNVDGDGDGDVNLAGDVNPGRQALTTIRRKGFVHVAVAVHDYVNERQHASAPNDTCITTEGDVRGHRRSRR